MEKHPEQKRLYLAEVPEADEISHDRHGALDKRSNLMGGVRAQIRGIHKWLVGGDGKRVTPEEKEKERLNDLDGKT